MYLVVECSTTSAPSASGDCRYGEANVLSTTSRAWASRATSATAAMSAMPSSGLVGVSHQIARVSGRSAARSAATSARSTGVCSMPHGRSTLSTSRNVPPYASCGITMWSPGDSSTRSRTSEAPIPDPNATACRPPSSAARHSWSAVRVGLALREYS